MAMARMTVVLGLFLLAGAVSATEVSPMDKVFQLMDELTAKITKEGEAEEKAYKEFYEWCDDSASDTKFSIKTAEKEKEKLEATIAKATADAEAATTKIDELSASIATAEADLKASTEIRTQEAADFAKVEAELVTGVEELEGAIAKIGAFIQRGKGAFIQQQVSSGNVQALLMTLDAVLSKAGIAAADKKKLVAMVQTQQKESDSDAEMDAEFGAPAGDAYSSHSGGITDILADMKDKAEGELSDARTAETKALHEFKLLKQGLDDQIAAENHELSDSKAALAEADETKSVASGDLAETEEELKTLKAQLETVSTDCMTSATDHETSMKSRAEELAVIAEAKKIVKDAVGGAASFVQVSASSKLQSRVGLAGLEVVAAVKKLARKQHSAALTQLASRIAAVARFGGSNSEDIFAKIKGLISDMIAKLQKEAAEAATKKAYCDEETAKTKAKKDELTSDTEALTAKIDKAAAASAELKEDVATLQKELADMQKLQTEMDSARADENAAFTEASTELQKGITGVQAALEVLRNYYGSSFVQQPAMPAGHSKSGGAGGSIISILEVCESDFSKSLAQEEMKEASAKEEYDKVTQENKVLKLTKEQDVKYKTKEFKGLDKSVSEWSSDRSGLSTELDAVLEYKAKIDSECIAKPESYEERKAAREAEIKGLKEALKILESEGVFLQKRRHMRHVARH
eukprot:gnl/TRDRNA2_/TRDRNA2_175777_c5_seq9.p1 gnl/TRDRNA2_/TRDRNA2_175777_c5~~gnl/TRDRNA2_/TRDRNA2_175777_c5_seq9.p1  ORF type:complete len:694 (+),score=268.16 gnl/TRDRNA2_/TRDRNA2_175777_c5_seq9:44-2125(+)